MRKITVYCEADLTAKKLENVSYELISKAHELVAKAKDLQPNDEFIVEAVVLADEIKEDSIKKAICAGANNFVLVKENCLNTFSQTIFSQCFVEFYKNSPSEVIIFPATPKGRMVAPRITTLLNTGLVADCTELDFIIRENKLKFAPTRPTFGSELMATILSKNTPQCATVRAGVFKANFDKELKSNFFEFTPTPYNENRIKLTNAIIDNPSLNIDFSTSNIVLVAGWGLCEAGGKEYFDKLEYLAKNLGAKVGYTRKVVDMGLAPQALQIGQTGTTIEAQLYIGFGVSGAIQHIMGMKNSKTIIAINTDENADIFKYADYKIVADAKFIIDELLKKIR